MEKLLKLVDELERKIIYNEKSDASVSGVTAGWHIMHSLLVISQIISRLKTSDPAVYRWKFSLARTYVYTIGRIPRGRGKAPEIVLPKGEINPEALENQIILVRNAVGEISSLDRNCYIKHPYFGDLNVKQVQTFLILHTVHHLNIIQDIIKKSESY